ncbi:MAG TPA: hypothetical protein VM884_04715 [Flavisolibacter sp.]|nr:hypothetical protein [Flavisolibacter sp.]
MLRENKKRKRGNEAAYKFDFKKMAVTFEKLQTTTIAISFPLFTASLTIFEK